MNYYTRDPTKRSRKLSSKKNPFPACSSFPIALINLFKSMNLQNILFSTSSWPVFLSKFSPFSWNRREMSSSYSWNDWVQNQTNNNRDYSLSHHGRSMFYATRRVKTSWEVNTGNNGVKVVPFDVSGNLQLHHVAPLSTYYKDSFAICSLYFLNALLNPIPLVILHMTEL